MTKTVHAEIFCFDGGCCIVSVFLFLSRVKQTEY